MKVAVARWAWLSHHWDVALVALLLVADLVELHFLHSLFWAEREVAGLPVLTGLAVVRAGALALRRRYPIAVGVIVSVTMITVPTNGLSYISRSYWPALSPQLGGDPGWWPTAFGWTALLEVLITAYTVAALRGRRPAVVVAGWHMLCITPWFLPQVITWGPGPYLLGALVFCIAIYLGGVRKRTLAVLSEVAARHDRIEKGRRQGVSDAARTERERISGELQRLVAEHLRTMMEQAQVARAEVEISGATDKAQAAIAAIERTGRAALTDARRALGLLREPPVLDGPAAAKSQCVINDRPMSMERVASPTGNGPTEANRQSSNREYLIFSLLLSVYLLSEVGGSQALPPWRALDDIAHPWDVTAMLMIAGPFLVGRRVPLMTCLLVTSGFALHALVGHFFGIASVIALLAAVYTVWAARGLGQGLVAATAAALVLPLAREQLASVFQFGLLTLYLPFLPAAGFFGWQERKLARALDLLSRQEAELNLMAEEERERARLEERLRIARELHDVTAHSLTVMTIQAGAARTVADRAPAEARRALTTIEETGRRAHGEIDELFSRSLDAAEPTFGIEALPALVRDMREAGLDVKLHLTSPTGALPRSLDISLYRVVQEALTNAMKHAGPTRVHVRVECLAGLVSVEVVDEGRAASIATAPDPSMAHSGGRGLIGIQERVKAYGGTMKAGSHGTGFTVHVAVPMGSHEADAMDTHAR